jgi:hypothetical protein
LLGLTLAIVINKIVLLILMLIRFFVVVQMQMNAVLIFMVPCVHLRVVVYSALGCRLVIEIGRVAGCWIFNELLPKAVSRRSWPYGKSLAGKVTNSAMTKTY